MDLLCIDITYKTWDIYIDFKEHIQKLQGIKTRESIPNSRFMYRSLQFLFFPDTTMCVSRKGTAVWSKKMLNCKLDTYEFGEKKVGIIFLNDYKQAINKI